MATLPLNLAHFKKVSSDGKTTILQHKDGHQISLAHQALSPKVRSQLAVLPIHKAEGGAVLPAHKAANSSNMAPILKENTKRKKMADGGAVESEDPKAPVEADDMDPQSAVAAQGMQQIGQSPIVQNALQSAGNNLDQYHAMLQAAMAGDPKAQQMLAQHSAGVAMGTISGPGIIGKAVDAVGGIDPRTVARGDKLEAARDLLEKIQGALNRKAPGVNQDMLRAAESHYNTIKATVPAPVKKFYDGGPTTKGSPADSSDASDKNGLPPSAAPANPAQAPVTININSGSSQLPNSMLNPSPGSQFQAAHPPITQATPDPPDPGNLPYGISPEALSQAAQANQASQQQMLQRAPSQQAPAPQAAAASEIAPSPEQQDPYGTQAYGEAYGQGLGEQRSGIFGEAEAAGKRAALEQQALQHQQAQQQQQIKTYNDHFSALDQERKAFMQDIQNQHIDPQHFMNNMGTGQKIATAIGLILGGIGGGLLHQENPAMKFLQSQIDRDIEGQKANLGKQESLLNANMHQFGNLKDATDMTRLMQIDIVSNQLKQAAAKTTDMAARSRALQAAGQLDQQAAPVLSQIAMRKTLLSGMAQGQIPPENIVRMVIPEKQQEAAYKELQAMQGMTKARDNILSAFDKIAQINTLGNRMSSPIQIARQVAALRDPLLAQLVKDAEGRITPQDTKMIEALFHAVGDDNETSMMKRAQMAKFITEKMNFPLLKAWGIVPQSRFNDSGQNKIQESAPVI